MKNSYLIEPMEDLLSDIPVQAALDFKGSVRIIVKYKLQSRPLSKNQQDRLKRVHMLRNDALYFFETDWFASIMNLDRDEIKQLLLEWEQQYYQKKGLKYE